MLELFSAGNGNLQRRPTIERGRRRRERGWKRKRKRKRKRGAMVREGRESDEGEEEEIVRRNGDSLYLA